MKVTETWICLDVALKELREINHYRWSQNKGRVRRSKLAGRQPGLGLHEALENSSNLVWLIRVIQVVS